MIDLTQQIHAGHSLLQHTEAHRAHREFQDWVDAVAKILDGEFPNSGLSAEWIGMNYSNLIRGGRESKKMEDWEPFRQVITERITWLSKLQKSEQSRQTPSAKLANAPTTSRKIFVVHGRDQKFRDSTARLLEGLDLEPIILHEQPNRGRTIIEKFTDYADVGFSVILLTGDDRGGLSGEDSAKYRSRARQNVILELGYFLGRLGRDRVCPLNEPGIELPSDYDGVVWTALDDAGAWKYKLAKEIQAAGIPVDLNKII